MKKLLKALSVSSVIAYAMVYSTAALATISPWGATCKPSNVPTDIRAAIMNVTNWILGFIAIVATLIIIYGGVQYLTAGGNEDSVASAKKTISYGIIGVVIAGLAYAFYIHCKLKGVFSKIYQGTIDSLSCFAKLIQNLNFVRAAKDNTNALLANLSLKSLN